MIKVLWPFFMALINTLIAIVCTYLICDFLAISNSVAVVSIYFLLNVVVYFVMMFFIKLIDKTLT